jgi:hypothetical protein
MNNPTDRRYFIQASNLVLIALALSIVYLFLPDIRMIAGMLPITIAMKCMILAVAILLRMGYSWSRYLLVVLALFTLFGIRDVLDAVVSPAISTIISIMQIALIVWATIVVFRKSESA